MNLKQQTTYELLKQLLAILEKHNLDYVAVYGTLLGAIRHKGFIPWDDDIDLLITPKTYHFLKEYYPDKIKDDTNSENFLLFPKFTNDTKNHVNATFIDLFILRQTTDHKLKKFSSLKNKIGIAHRFTKRHFLRPLWIMNLLKIISFWMWWFPPTTIAKAAKEVDQINGDKQVILITPFKKHIKRETYSLKFNFFDTEKVKFEDIEINVPKQAKNILANYYGENWETPIKYRITQHVGLFDMEL